MKYVVFFVLSLIGVVGCAKPTYLAKDGKGGAAFRDQGVKCDARFEKSSDCITVVWEKAPTETDYGSFIFKTFRPNLADQSPIVEALSGTMAVRLFMPSMGHGSSPITLTQIDTGTFRASGVFFSMHGDWQIIFELKTGSQVNDKAVLPITF